MKLLQAIGSLFKLPEHRKRTCTAIAGPLVLLILSFFCIPLRGQISPGELSKVHSSLEGMSNCTKCHVLGKKVSNQKCLECHSEVKTRVDAGKGYHSSVEVKGKECVSCHSDHHGINFQIIRFAKEKFSHTLAGWPLTGAHAGKTCADCHKAANITDPKIRRKSFTYLGLGTACLTCHKDYHQQSLGQDCAACHGDQAFKPAARFDHGKAKFRLSGRHQEVACVSCHPVTTRNNAKFQEFKGIKFDNCSSCHKDVHGGKFGTDCAKCHSEISFKTIRGTSNFDHAQTAFPLEGKHSGVACATCHKGRFGGTMKFGRCTDCHTDYHRGALSREGVAPDCKECHTVQGFKPFNYTTERHNLGRFPLKGAHMATPCIACHLKDPKPGDTAWKLSGLGKSCIDCHTNEHSGKMSASFTDNNGCASCHTEERWGLVKFDHSRSAFVLEGKHTGVSCGGCHYRKEAGGATLQQFKGLSQQCVYCHTDIHSGQFLTDGATDCNRCHVTTGFKPAPKFDHAKTRFPLDGKHIKVACTGCHKPVTENGRTFIVYKIKAFKCEDCHH